MKRQLDMSEFDFSGAYRGDEAVTGVSFPTVPWDIGAVQPVVEELLRRNRFAGSVLDIGCGPGYAAIHLARLGYPVTGVDFVPAVIDDARGRAAQHGVTVSFDVADATSLDGYTDRFDTILDLALFHCLEGETAKSRYARAIHRAARSDAALNLVCFSDRTLNGVPAPAPVSEVDLRHVLDSGGWEILDLRPGSYMANVDPMRAVFSHIGFEFDGSGDVVELPVWIAEARRRDRAGGAG
ncbi:class I SAM-dependent methyltransferase [Nocardia tengchongensis]